jgi:hypothetical protein
MGLPPAILELENRNVGRPSEPTLGAALELAVAEWRVGNQDRELRLHLLFLSWYCNLEPAHLTGLSESSKQSAQLPELFLEIYETFADGILEDVECLYVVGLVAQLTPWLLGETVDEWEARSKEFRTRYRTLVPKGLTAAVFEGRGAYGDYFAGHVAIVGGF